MQPQAPQTDAANPVNQPVEQMGNRELQQQAIGLDLAKLVFDASGDLNQMLQGLVRVILEHSQCNGVWLASTKTPAELPAEQQFDFVTLIQPDTLWPIVEGPLRSFVGNALKTEAVCQIPLEGHSKTSLIAAPVLNGVRSSSELQLILTGCFNNAEESMLRQQWLMSMAAQTISHWQQTRLAFNQNTVNQNLKDAFGVVHLLSQTDSAPAAARLMVNHLQTALECDQVALSLCEDAGSVTISAVSGVEQVDLQSEYAAQTIAALQQPFIQHGKVEFAVGQEKQSTVELALENYCIVNGSEAAIALPILDSTKTEIGSILIGCSKDQFQSSTFQTKCRQIVELVAGHLPTVLRANESLLKTVSNRFAKLKASATLRNFMIGMTLVLASLCVPTPYRVWCDCKVQPVERRFVAAPYDGVLAQSLVRGGDQVSAQQVVARLDGRVLRGELAGVQAEFDVSRKRRDLALATGDVAQSQIAKSEMTRHQAKITILNQRLENLDVRSPIDGVVVTGDLEKTVGVPLELGQTLFEIAPLATMVAEVGVPESEADYVKPGMQVQLKFDSFPFQTFSAEIQRIHPRAEVVDNDSVFVAEVVLQNAQGRLRPGMNGDAKVSTGWSPLGWNLFHRPWESIRYWMIW